MDIKPDMDLARSNYAVFKSKKALYLTLFFHFQILIKISEVFSFFFNPKIFLTCSQAEILASLFANKVPAGFLVRNDRNTSLGISIEYPSIFLHARHFFFVPPAKHF